MCDLDITPNSRDYPAKKYILLVRRMNVFDIGNEMVKLESMLDRKNYSAGTILFLNFLKTK